MTRIHLSIRLRKLVAITAVLLATPADAQLLHGLPLRSLPLGSLAALPATALGALPIAGVTARLAQVTALLRAHPHELERGPDGEVVVRGEVLAVAPDGRALAAARAAGFEIADESDADTLGIRLVTLRPPAGLGTRAALKRLRALDPGGSYDLNPIFVPGGGTGVVVGATAAGREAPDARIGLVDSGVATAHPDFAAARIETRGFVGPVVAAPHGTAVASLLVGTAGAARGARLFAADVYGAGPTGGNARALVGAFGWLASLNTGVVNVSLVGPANAALKAAVDALIARGSVVVAAVGNDGPAGKPLYPAAYPGVVAVTAIDARGRLLPEAGSADHTDFAAPGIARAADPAGGFVQVRGTSFAAPVVTADLARLHPLADPATMTSAITSLARDGIAAPRR